MSIKLSNEQMESVKNECDLIVNGELWKYIEQESEEEDEQGRYYSHIFQRPSDKKYFLIDIFYSRYGYKDYGYEDYKQDKTAYEVKKKIVTTTTWVFN